MGTNIDSNLNGISPEDTTTNQGLSAKREYERIFPEEGGYSTALQIIHYSAIHAIRDFATRRGFGVAVSRSQPLKPYENLANACRSALAATMHFDPEVLHCTISYCGGKKAGKATSERKVWNFAHSTSHRGRPLRLGPDEPTAVGANSSYAALLACKDNKDNKWSYPHSCFACDNLQEVEYAAVEEDWNVWYNSRLVFPLRFQTRDRSGKFIDNVTGFLEFDSRYSNVFQVPSIFAYNNDPQKYSNELESLAVCNAGGIIADSIATAIFLEKSFVAYIIKHKEKGNGTKKQ